MPRSRWVRDREWQQQPHVKDGPPPSLWWFARPDRHRVIDAYIAQCKRGITLPEGFKDDVVQWLADLSRIKNKKEWGKPRTYRYWDIPSYARAHGIEPPTLMARLRKMEAIAIELFSDSVPSSRTPRGLVSEEEKQQIKQRYLAGEDCKELAEEFRITSGHVGLICRDEKAQRDAERLRLMDQHNAPTGAPESADPDVPM